MSFIDDHVLPLGVSFSLSSRTFFWVMANAFLKLVLGMSLTYHLLKLGDPGLVLAPIAITAERSFGILG